MFPDENKTYPGRKFIQALQVGLVAAIGVFGMMALTGPREIPPVQETLEPSIAETATAFSEETPSYYDRALEAQDEGSYDEAIDLYTQSLEVDTATSSTWLNRAVAYEQSGDEVRSRNDFRRYIQFMKVEHIEREIKDDQTLTLDMIEGRVYVLSFEGKIGDRLNLTATGLIDEESGDEVDPVMLLLDAEGLAVASNDDTLRSNGSLINMNSSISNYRTTQDGTYTLLVTHAGGGSEGKIDVTLDIR